MRTASVSPSSSPQWHCKEKEGVKQQKLWISVTPASLRVHGSSQGEEPRGVWIMANQLCAEILVSASQDKTHLSAFSFLRRSVQMVWLWLYQPNWRNTKYEFLWSMNQLSVSHLGKYFARIMQEFWLYELWVSSSSLESGPPWFKKVPSINFMDGWNEAEMFHN